MNLFCLVEVIPTADVAVAFKDVEAAFLVGAMPRREGMERKDLLSANVKIFKVQVSVNSIFILNISNVLSILYSVEYPKPS